MDILLEVEIFVSFVSALQVGNGNILLHLLLAALHHDGRKCAIWRDGFHPVRLITGVDELMAIADGVMYFRFRPR